MVNLFKKIKYFLLSQKESFLQKKLQHTTKRSFISGKTKRIMTTGADLTFNNETLKIIENVKSGVENIVKKANGDADKLLDYVKAAKTKVYFLNNADKFLNLIKEEEGLLCEHKGIEALYLSVITGQGFKFKTEPMFVIRKGKIDNNYFLHHFYRWYSLKSGLEGFDYETQKLLKQFLYGNSEYLIKNLSMQQMIALKEAITRDNEATDFVLKYTKSKDGATNVINKIRNDGSANV